MKKVMLIYPPGDLYQRGEDRCQLNINASSANAARACNDLGYASSILKLRGYSIFLKDYPSEKLSLNDLLNDFVKEKPDVVFISTTNTTIFYDIEIVKKLKAITPELVVILKGAIFYDADNVLLAQISEINYVDYLIGGESEFIIGDLIDFHFNSPEKISQVNSIFYQKDNNFYKTSFGDFNDDLDSLPFPDRSLMNNSLYVMPDTGEKLATIATSRGCPSSCIYCLSPKISGRKLRLRSPKNILEELKECYTQHGIRNFFFKSDTFTINAEWVKELCEMILNSELNGKIRWSANARTNTVNEEMLRIMKKAGCFLIAYGLESGSSESLTKMKKGSTLEKNYEAVKLAKKVGLYTFGFYIIGFPWEDFSHFELTKRAMFKYDTDFIELHIATPFFGTDLYEMLKSDNKIDNTILGTNHFTSHSAINKNLNPNDVESYRQRTVLQYYLRPKYIIKKIIQSIMRPKVLINYIKYGLRLIKNFCK